MCNRNRTRFICFCVMFMAVFSGCRQRNGNTGSIPVRVETLKTEAIVSELRYSATVREWHRIELSFKVPGTVDSLLQVPDPDGKLRDVHEGDNVTDDEEHPLSQLDISDYKRKVNMVRDKLAQAKAQESAALANVTAIRATFDRIKALRERDSVPQQTYDETLAKRDSAVAQLEASRREVGEATTALQQADDDLKNTKLTLPIPRAVVSRRNVESGERVQAGQPVFQIMDLSKVRIAFGVPDTKVNTFQIGQTVTVTADGFPGEKFTGRITKIVPAADLKTRTFEVELTIEEPRGLRPGMVVTILVGKQKEGLLLPMTAVHRGKGKDEYFVYTLAEENGKTVARQRRVQLDGVFDNRIQLVEGGESQIKAGDVIVVTGGFRLTDGLEIKVLNVQDPQLKIDM